MIARTERTLLGMADGFTRLHDGKRIGVCAVQNGPGAENAYAGVAQANSDSTPILIFPGGPRRARRGVPYAYQAAIEYRGVTKWSDEINMPERVPEMLRRAYNALRNGRRGPVLLELPSDVAAGMVDSSAIEAYVPPRTYRSVADPRDVEAACAMLAAAERPVILAGQGALYAGASAALEELAALLRAPVLTTMNGKSAFREDHPLSLGAAGATSTEPAAGFVDEADVILGVGSSFSRTQFSHPLPDGRRLIQITTDERDFEKDYVLALGLCGDAALTVA
ncbi:MAG: thiamine pyrophosphate-binding protein, partial [Chloroflexi bacterium]|nr:thiamine pyrophosphate-binding protein [Chloroflexota bacterium]